MSHYTTQESSVRASLFKPSGKWSEDFALDMTYTYHDHPVDAVRKAWEASHDPLYDGWRLVVLEPYNIHSHPVMIVGESGS